MHFPSTKALVLRLLAGQAVIAAPTRHGSSADRSVQLTKRAESAGIDLNNAESRRALEILDVLSERLYSRATPPGKKPLDKEPLIDKPDLIQFDPTKTPSDLSSGDDPEDWESLPGEGSKPDNSQPANNKERLPMYAVDSDEWKSNLDLVAAKGQKVKDDSYEAIDTQTAGDGRKDRVEGEKPKGMGYLGKRYYLDDELTDMSYLQTLFGLDLGQDDDAVQDEPSGSGSPPRKKPKIVVEKGERDWLARNIYTYNSAKTVQTSAFSLRNRAVSVMVSDKNADTLPEGDQARWTHLMYDSMKEMLKAEGMRTLKWINRHQVISYPTEGKDQARLDTPDAIEFAFRTLNVNTQEVLEVDLESTDTNMVKVANYLTAQTHVARVLQLLAEYREDFGYKKIAKVHLIHTDNTALGGHQTISDIGLQVPTDQTVNENAYGIVIELTEGQPQPQDSDEGKPVDDGQSQEEKSTEATE